MDKRAALEIYLKAHDECEQYPDCNDCAFREVFGDRKICILCHTGYSPVARMIRKKLKNMEEKQEESSVPPKNVEVKTTFYAKAPISAEELDKRIKELLPQKLALEPLPKEDRAIKMPVSSKPDNVNHPRHYCKGGIECIDAIRAAVSDLRGVEAVYAGNVIKYVWRYKGKNGLEDLKKAKHYLEWLIESLEG